MKKNIFNFIFCILSMIAIIFIFKHNLEVQKVIIDAVNLFLNRVFVSLFPMFIINDILISLNIPYYFYKIFNGIFRKAFKTSGICAYVFIMSLISGTPSNAYILKNLVSDNKLSVREANHYLYFTYFSNPLFLMTMLTQIFATKIAIKIILIHYCSNLIIGLALRKKAPNMGNSQISFKADNITSTLIKSINRSISTLLMILGTIVFYMLITYIFTNYLPCDYFIKTILAGLLEIRNGLNMLKNLTILNEIKEIIAVIIISFGGLSINTQIKAILEDTDLNYKYFFNGRLMQALISFILIIIF